MRGLAVLVCAFAVVTMTAGIATTALAGDGNFGFQTSHPPYLVGSAPGVSVKPLITVGDRVGDYSFESIPDGLAVRRAGPGRWEVYVNHELSLVPFQGRSDFTNSIVSRLVMNNGGRIQSGEYVIPTTANYQRFCSSFLVSEEHGFERDLLLTNEEATDFVYRTGDAWPVNEPTDPREPEQAGVVVALDIESGQYRTIYGMGRHNHENSVAIPGYGYPVVLSGDDTFNAPSSQVYMYTAPDGQAVWDDTGTLYALKSVDSEVNDYGDMDEGADVDVQFIEVPEAIADGGQTGLENWSNANDVFQFIRIEDIAYDRNDPRTVYMADTGEPRATPDALTGRLKRGASGTNGRFMNGRIWKLVLGTNPLTGTLSILPNANFDLGDYANAGVVHQPDNIETTENALYIQEDTGSHNSSQPPTAYPAFPDATNARIWRYDLKTRELSVVATVDQSQLPDAAKASWESSGIVDASAAFGKGAFLVDVQAHGLELDRAPGNGFEYRREAGQLLLIRIPGA